MLNCPRLLDQSVSSQQGGVCRHDGFIALFTVQVNNSLGCWQDTFGQTIGRIWDKDERGRREKVEEKKVPKLKCGMICSFSCISFLLSCSHSSFLKAHPPVCSSFEHKNRCLYLERWEQSLRPLRRAWRMHCICLQELTLSFNRIWLKNEVNRRRF